MFDVVLYGLAGIGALGVVCGLGFVVLTLNAQRDGVQRMAYADRYALHNLTSLCTGAREVFTGLEVEAVKTSAEYLMSLHCSGEPFDLDALYRGWQIKRGEYVRQTSD